MKKLTKNTATIFFTHARAYPWALFFALVGISAAEITSLLSPLWYKKIIDLLSSGGPVSEMYMALVVIALLYGANWCAFRVTEFANSYFQTHVMRDLANRCFAYVHQHATPFFDSTFVGALVKKVNRFSRSFERIADRIIWSFVPLFVSLIGIIWVFGSKTMWFVVFVFAWLICFVGGNILFSKYKLQFDLKRTAQDSKVTGLLADTITNHQNVKLLNGYHREVEKFQKETAKQQRLEKHTWDLASISFAFQGLLTILLELGIMYLAIRMWQQGLLTVGDFALLQAYLLQLFEKTWVIGHMIRDVYEAFADAEEMTEILNTPHGIIDIPTATSLHVSEGKISLEGVSFMYNQTRTILDDVTVTIQGGERVAFVGHSGAGKSTIVKLLLRMHDVTSGHINIDGQDIAKKTRESLWEHIAYVPQEPILFHRTLLENIRYGRPEATDEEVRTAARLAHADEFISNFPDRYDTYVGERGVKLSGGERQRVAIARAMLKNAPILILDEATSSLDSESERYIQDALDTLMKGKTVIVIAHRLSTVMKMDRILVMEGGRIVEDGSHTELLGMEDGVYKKYWELQAGEFIT